MCSNNPRLATDCTPLNIGRRARVGMAVYDNETTMFLTYPGGKCKILIKSLALSYICVSY